MRYPPVVYHHASHERRPIFWATRSLRKKHVHVYFYGSVFMGLLEMQRLWCSFEALEERHVKCQGYHSVPTQTRLENTNVLKMMFLAFQSVFSSQPA